MRKANSLPSKWWIVVFFLTAFIVVAIDQFSKEWVRFHLDVGQSLPATGWLRLTHVRNSGAAFGLFQGQSFTLTVVAILGIAVLLFYTLLIFRRYPFLDNTLGKIALGLILGGTVGNLIDRLVFGYVTDFMDVGFWPAFNMADSSIVVGAIIFAYSLLSLTRVRERRIGRR